MRTRILLLSLVSLMCGSVQSFADTVAEKLVIAKNPLDLDHIRRTEQGEGATATVSFDFIDGETGNAIHLGKQSAYNIDALTKRANSDGEKSGLMNFTSDASLLVGCLGGFIGGGIYTDGGDSNAPFLVGTVLGCAVAHYTGKGLGKITASDQADSKSLTTAMEVLPANQSSIKVDDVRSFGQALAEALDR